jgi:hypothetical protein
MALAFKRVRLEITDEAGKHVDTVTDAFGKDIKLAITNPSPMSRSSRSSWTSPVAPPPTPPTSCR